MAPASNGALLNIHYYHEGTMMINCIKWYLKGGMSTHFEGLSVDR